MPCTILDLQRIHAHGHEQGNAGVTQCVHFQPFEIMLDKEPSVFVVKGAGRITKAIIPCMLEENEAAVIKFWMLQFQLIVMDTLLAESKRV